jgi:hypothetical protein
MLSDLVGTLLGSKYITYFALAYQTHDSHLSNTSWLRSFGVTGTATWGTRPVDKRRSEIYPESRRDDTPVTMVSWLYLIRVYPFVLDSDLQQSGHLYSAVQSDSRVVT